MTKLMNVSKYSASYINRMESVFPKSILDEQAALMLSDGNAENRIHKIGIINIYKTKSNLVVAINEESLHMRWRDSLQEAIDYYLDNISYTKNVKQGCLFDE